LETYIAAGLENMDASQLIILHAFCFVHYQGCECGGAHEGQVVIAFPPRELREGENTLSSQIWNILVTTRQNQIRIFHPTLYRMCRRQEQVQE
jgi:hypothetical protein